MKVISVAIISINKVDFSSCTNMVNFPTPSHISSQCKPLLERPAIEALNNMAFNSKDIANETVPKFIHQLKDRCKIKPL